jgi:hypothetical protein
MWVEVTMVRRTTRTVWGLAAVLGAVLGLSGLSVMFLRAFQSVVYIGYEPAFDWKAAQSIIAALAEGELKADACGLVILPTRYASSRLANRAYVLRKGKSLTLILFPTSEGWDGYVDGYLWSSRSLVRADMAGRDTSSGHLTIKLPYGKRQPCILAAVVRQLKAHWYEVHHDEFTHL